MGSTQFGNFEQFCHDGTLPVCNLFSPSDNQDGAWGGCKLLGIPLANGQYLGNLGSILLSALGMAAAVYLIHRSERKRAAVGRREMQVFLVGYFLISLCEIFSIGEFPLNGTVRVVFSGLHIGFITATLWALMINALVGYQLIDDGTPLSLGALILSSAVLFIGTAYIALDTGLQWTGYWDDSLVSPNRQIALYVLYQLLPLVFLVAFFLLETMLVLRILGETRPMLYLAAAAVLFALGQIFTYVVSTPICEGTAGKIDGSMFQTLFNLLAVVTVWIFWSSITEDDWPQAVNSGPNYNAPHNQHSNVGSSYP